MKRGLSYNRVSSDEQVLGRSLEIQQRDILEFAENNNIEIVETVVDEGVSAYHMPFFKRPHSTRIMELIVEKKIDCILVTHGDRLCRNGMDARSVVEFLQKNDISLVFVREGFAFETPEDKLMFTIKFGFAEYSSDLNAAKVKASMIRKTKMGEFAGQPPLGYKLVDKRLVVDEEKAEVVRMIFDLYVNQNYGLEKIVNYLNQRNILGKLWSKGSLYDLIMNRNLTGDLIYNKRAARDSGKRYKKEDDFIIKENNHEPIIDKETFYKAQELRKSRNRHKEEYKPRDGSRELLSGLLVCKECGNLYAKNRTKNDYREYVYYQCMGKKRHGTKFCSQKMIDLDMINNVVMKSVAEQFDFNLLRKQIQERITYTLKEKEFDLQNKKVLTDKLEQYKKEVDKLFKIVLSLEDVELIAEYNKQIRDRKREITEVEKELEIFNSDFEMLEENYNILLQELDHLKRLTIPQNNVLDYQKKLFVMLKSHTKEEVRNYLLNFIEKIEVQDVDKNRVELTIHYKFNTENIRIICSAKNISQVLRFPLEVYNPVTKEIEKTTDKVVIEEINRTSEEYYRNFGKYWVEDNTKKKEIGEKFWTESDSARLHQPYPKKIVLLHTTQKVTVNRK